MKIIAAPHPLMNQAPTLMAPTDIERALARREVDFPPEAWHLGFSRTGDLVYRSDNLPALFATLPTLKAQDLFFTALADIIPGSESRVLDEFRTQIFADKRSHLVFKVRRKDLTLPPRLGISARKFANGIHFLFIPEGSGTDVSVVKNPNFSGWDNVLEHHVTEWLTKLDEETLCALAFGAFQGEYRQKFEPGVIFRTARGTPIGLARGVDPTTLPGMPQNFPVIPRIWGSSISEERKNLNHLWIHNMIRCARILPVISVSANADFLQRTSLATFRKALQKMERVILNSVKTFTWSPQYRYARQWLVPAGYDIRQAEHMIGLIRHEIPNISLLPVRANGSTMKGIEEKTRMDEPFFWDQKEEQAWVLLRNISLENAETMVRPSFSTRLETMVGTPVTLETFLNRYGRPSLPTRPDVLPEQSEEVQAP